MVGFTDTQVSKLSHPNDMERDIILTFWPDYYDRLIKLTDNRFWLDFPNSLKTLWECYHFTDKCSILKISIWYNPHFSLQIKKEWYNKGMVVADFIDYLNVLLSLEQLHTRYGLKINFIEYAQNKRAYRLDWDVPAYYLAYARNSFLNCILSLDTKGVSNLYKELIVHGNRNLWEITNKWKEEANINVGTNKLI